MHRVIFSALKYLEKLFSFKKNNYLCNQVSPMRRKRRELRQVLWVQGGGMIFVG